MPMPVRTMTATSVHQPTCVIRNNKAVVAPFFERIIKDWIDRRWYIVELAICHHDASGATELEHSLERCQQLLNDFSIAMAHEWCSIKPALWRTVGREMLYSVSSSFNEADIDIPSLPALLHRVLTKICSSISQMHTPRPYGLSGQNLRPNPLHELSDLRYNG